MTRKIRARSLLIGGVFTLFFVVLLVKVYWIQVVEASMLLGKAEQSWEDSKVLAPERGSIVDRNGKVLAVDAAAYTVALNPMHIDVLKDTEDVVQGLTDILKESDASRAQLESKIRNLATKKKDDGTLAPYSEIRNEGWKIEKERADKVKELMASLQKKFKTKGSVGIQLTEEKKRYYPGETLASHLLGYSNKEGKAVIGIEAQLDDVLKGVPGKLNYESDAKGVELLDSKVVYKPAENGKDVRLTIDKNIQFYIESALAKVNEKFHPKSLMAIAVDPKSMEILGMANLPNFNPNQYWTIDNNSDFINRGVASQYEPGSTFKIVTLAGTVEEGLFNPNEMYQSGSIKVPGRTLHDHNVVGWGQISFLDGLKRSSNVAFVKLGYEKLGQDKLKSYIDKFGFGVKTGIDIPGEVPGIISMKQQADFATATYGQGKVVATAIQQTAAYAAIANGGKLMWPHVIKDILDPKTGAVVQSFAPREVRQVVSEKTAKQVTAYLEQVVSDQVIGTGKNAFIDGYRVAGKTGTANVVVDGGYSPDQWVVSFVGYAPADNPKILVTIIADQPDLGGDYHKGGDVAAPAFKDIVTQSLQYMGVPSNKQTPNKTVDKESSKITVPDFHDLTLDAAMGTAKQFGIKAETLGKGPKVLGQFPKAGTEIGLSQRIYLVMQQMEEVSLPNLTGKSLRDAMEVCSFLHANCQASGQGYVTDQSVSGEGENRVITLQLKPLRETMDTSTNGQASKVSKDASTDSKAVAVDPKKAVSTLSKSKQQ